MESGQDDKFISMNIQDCRQIIFFFHIVYDMVQDPVKICQKFSLRKSQYWSIDRNESVYGSQLGYIFR